MNSSSEPDESYTTANSRLLPAIFEPPKVKNGRMKILEPHGRRRRPKAGDFKLLAAYVAAYVGVLIPKEDYERFIDPRGEREWKRTLRAACDIEWRLQDIREFDDIPAQEYKVMSEYVAHAWPFTKHFDGSWIIKWALRTTWTNRRKAYIRSDKGIEKRRQAVNGLDVPSEGDNPSVSQQARRPRASKLGQSLYCVGGCQRMLTLEQFPTNHVGICTMCSGSSNTAVPLSQSQNGLLRRRQDTLSTREHLSSEQLQPHVWQRVQRRAAPCSAPVARELSSIHRQQNPHSVLSGSVTTYSDAGQYPSGRSTYGVTKPSQRGRRGRTKTTTLPVRQLTNQNGQMPRDKATTDKLQDLNELFSSLTQSEYNSFVRSLGRKVAGTELQQSQMSQETNQNEASQSTSETEDEDLTADVTLYPVTAAVTRCTDKICKLWDVPDIAFVFPKAIWPNPKTPWPIGVLEEFRTMAQEYPDKDSRQGICTKFAELVTARRKRSNAKSQWSIADARTTHVWAKEQCRLLSASNQDNREHTNTAGLQSSQQLQKLSGKGKGKQKATLRTYSQKRGRRAIEINSVSGMSDVESYSGLDSD